MKKIINGKLYDTTTARRVGSWSNNLSSSDFNHADEELYRKRTGEYFLHGSGGPMSRWAVPTGERMWSGGENIIPLTYDEATEWAEERLDADEYQEIFGEIVEESDEIVQMKFYLRSSTADLIRQNADREGLQLSAYAEKLLLTALEKNEQQ